MDHALQQQAQYLDLLASRLRHPANRLNAHRQDLANIGARAFFASQANQYHHELTTLRLWQRLNSASPHLMLGKDHLYVNNLVQRLGHLYRNLANDPTRNLSSLTARQSRSL